MNDRGGLDAHLRTMGSSVPRHKCSTVPQWLNTVPTRVQAPDESKWSSQDEHAFTLDK